MYKYVLFDLDETVYPASSGLMPAIGDRMRMYLERTYDLAPEDAHTLQKRYWTEYGTTLRGLMLERKINPEEYLLYVHDVNLAEYIGRDERLRAVLAQIPYNKVIVTNGDVPHAERVLERLGVADQFMRIFDIVFMEYECKPARGAYERVLKALDARGGECILVEDSARNLKAARELDIRTVLLLPEDAAVQPSNRFPDPALAQSVTVCPPEADICIASIYEVGEAIEKIAPAAAPPLSHPD
jgi:putative hydrolase of the HAD superfamily